jgi:hypothetical protein
MIRRLTVKQVIQCRDAQWTRRVLGIRDAILTPKQGAKWLEQDRIQRARNVYDARPRRTPPNW